MAKMSAKRHLMELQWRFMIIAAFFIVGASLAYTYRDVILPLLLAPLHGEKLIYLTPGGGFSFIFLVSIYAGLAVTFPVFLYQLYGFLRPTLPKKAQRKSAIIIISSVLLLLAGVAFGYFVAVPNALTFLYGFADQYVESSLTADSYLNFIVAYTMGIGIVFQIPLLLLFLHFIKPFTPSGILKSEKWVILGAFIIAAIITPTPDPVNQTIIAGPVVVVYQFGVIAILISIARAHRHSKKQTKLSSEQIRDFAVAYLAPAHLSHSSLSRTITEARKKATQMQHVMEQEQVVVNQKQRARQLAELSKQQAYAQAEALKRQRLAQAQQAARQRALQVPTRSIDGIIAPQRHAAA